MKSGRRNAVVCGRKRYGVNLGSTDLSVNGGYNGEDDYGREDYGPEGYEGEYYAWGDYGEEDYGREDYKGEYSNQEEYGEEYDNQIRYGRKGYAREDYERADYVREEGYERTENAGTEMFTRQMRESNPAGESLSSADIFTGKITMPPVYEEDEAPFDADALTPAESAQRLVAEGISHIDDIEGIFGRPVTVPAFSGPAAEPSFQGLADEEIVHPISHEKAVISEKAGEERTDLRLGLLINGFPMNQKPREEADEDRAPGSGILEIWPEEEWGEDFSDEAAVGVEEEAEEEIYLGDEKEYQEDRTDYWESTKEYQVQEETGSEEHYPDENHYLRGEISYPDEQPEAQMFSADRESRRVVTSSGKVIDSDTEVLQKKLEIKRREAREADGVGETSVLAQIKEKEEQPRENIVFLRPVCLNRASVPPELPNRSIRKRPSSCSRPCGISAWG